MTDAETNPDGPSFHERLTAGVDPAAVAVRASGLSMTHARLARLVAGAAGRLEAAGVGPGDRVLIHGANSVEVLVAILGALSRGGVALPVTTGSGARRLRHAIEVTDPCIVLVRDPADAPADGPPVATIELDVAGGDVRFTPAATQVVTGETPPQPPGDDAPGMILLSSGSTGSPKGVVLSRGGLLWTARTLASAFAIDPGHVELVISPLAHSGGWQRAAATLSRGGTVVLYQGTVSLTGILEDCATHGVTGFYTPPPLVRYLLKSDPGKVRAAMRTCRTVEVGSAPITAAELSGLMELLEHARIFTHYGLTECSRGVILDARAHPGKLDTVGTPPAGVEVAVFDAEGRRLGVGERGAIRLRGPQLSTGYWGRPELTRERFVDGWIATGDHGTVDADGFLRFLGREDDMITSSGFSFFPAEVEAELGDVPGVARYVIAGVDDPAGMLGHLPCIFVVPEDPATWVPQGLLKLARKRLPAHMVPRRTVVVPDLPETATGKSDRRRTVELYADSIGRG